LQLVKKFPAFYGTRRFITAFTSARHLYLSWASPIQSIPPHPTSLRSILILSSHLHLGLPGGLSLMFPHQNPVHASPLPHPSYMPRPSHSSRFYHPHNSGWGVPTKSTRDTKSIRMKRRFSFRISRLIGYPCWHYHNFPHFPRDEISSKSGPLISKLFPIHHSSITIEMKLHVSIESAS
jgi:hypothetical protein